MTTSSLNEVLTDRTCPICFDDISDEDEYVLSCNHILHKKCSLLLMHSKIEKKCPKCRHCILNPDISFLPDFTMECSICCREMKFDPALCDLVVSNDCGCYFHYDCIKEMEKIGCRRCGCDVDRKNIDAMSYLYFDTGYEKWVGKIQCCRKSDCWKIGNPKRFGYCINHQQKIARNCSVILSFIFMIRYCRNQDQNIRRETFNYLLYFFDKFYPNANSRDINIEEAYFKIKNNNLISFIE